MEVVGVEVVEWNTSLRHRQLVILLECDLVGFTEVKNFLFLLD